MDTEDWKNARPVVEGRSDDSVADAAKKFPGFLLSLKSFLGPGAVLERDFLQDNFGSVLGLIAAADKSAHTLGGAFVEDGGCLRGMVQARVSVKLVAGEPVEGAERFRIGK